MQRLIEIWQQQYYIPLLEDFIITIALIVSLKNRKKFKLLKYFPVYAATLLLTSITLIISHISKDLKFHPKFFRGLADYVDHLFTLLELIIFSHLYYQIINNRIIKKSIIVINILFLFFFIFMTIEDDEFFQEISLNTKSIVYTLEAIILLFLCSYYFYELFKKLPVLNLKNEPVFWVSTGLMFFMACTLPYSFLENYIRKNFPQFTFSSYAIFYIFYTLFFIMIIRAYLCKPEKMI